MRFQITHWFIIALIIVCHLAISYATICGKFNIGGPCTYLPETTTTTTTASPFVGLDSDYCLLACAQDQKDAFAYLCKCAKESCYYTRNRPAKLSTISKRMYSGTPIATACDYPGVVGIYNATNQKLQCMGVLLEENTIMIDSFCYKLVNSTRCVAAVESYQKPTDFLALPSVLVSTAKILDSPNNKIYSISLSASVVFNNACIQPACVPNENLPLTDIDLDDCRIVGYGDTTDTIGSTSSTLLEVKVKVDRTTVASGSLKYTRLDGLSAKTGPCFSDQGASLICNHLKTGEWVTVGVAITVGFKCSQGGFTAPVFASLLKESTNHNLYNGLQTFKYIPK